jgi:hypothetical protein
MVHILERVEAHYESREMPFGKVYEWHPALVALECDCGEKVTLSATSTTSTCGRCGADLGTFVYEIREREGRLPNNLTHPWFYDAKERAEQHTHDEANYSKGTPGVTTILRRPPTRSKPKEKNSHASRTNRQRDGTGGPVEAGEGPSPANRTIVRLSACGRPSDLGR